MHMNATTIVQILLLLTVIIVGLTLRFAKGKTTNLLLVGIFALLLNVLFAPAGWIYCWYWSTKPSL